MNDSIRIQLMEYYQRCNISPQLFNCPHQEFCRSFAFQIAMTERKMSMVGCQYGAQLTWALAVT